MDSTKVWWERLADELDRLLERHRSFGGRLGHRRWYPRPGEDARREVPPGAVDSRPGRRRV